MNFPNITGKLVKIASGGNGEGAVVIKDERGAFICVVSHVSDSSGVSVPT